MEKLKLVTDFVKLRQADLVEVHCDHHGCGKKHRGMLLSRICGWGSDPSGETSESVAWRLTRHLGWREMWISPITVARRIVYLVDVGLDSSTDTATAEPAPRKKARAL